MSEFRIHHHVSELLSLLGVAGGEGPEVYTEMLTKNMTPYVTTQVSAHTSKTKIAESSTTPREFLKKYEELKSKNVRELDPLVYLLSKVVDDKQMVSFFERNSKVRSRARLAALKGGSRANVSAIQDAIPASGTMTQQELNELRSQLANASNVTLAGITPEEKLKILREKQSKRTVNIPGAPSWVVERPYLSRDYIPATESITKKKNNIGTLPVPMQELAAVEDLLFLLMGIEGKYISVKPLKDKFSIRTFTVDRTLDVSINELVQRILPVCSHYSTVCRFIEEKSSFEHGLVNHALCAAMRTLLKEYYVLVAQLEHQFRLGQLSLQKLWFYIQPCIRTLEILSSIAVSVDKGNCKGGAVLTLLHEKTVSFTGDNKAQELCLFLTQAACVPFLDTLEQWIYKGIINDPYSEFLVAEHGSVQKEKLTEDYNDAYWEQRYTVIRENIPIFLEKVAQNILSTGKYLNVIRQCGRDVRCPDAEEIIYTLREREYVDNIEKAYNYASKTLLSVLMDERELMARLSSIKHYFLMDLGDFFVQFMDLAEDELRKNMDDIVPSRLETLLELALRTSTANSDPYKDDLRTKLLPYDLITQLFRILSVAYDSKGGASAFQQDPTELQISGLEAFSFDYVVKWPVSLILSKKALTKYQMLFRHLFYAKHVERQLCNVWLSNKKAKQFTLHSSPWYAAAFALRQRMLHFVQTFEHFMMFEVLDPNWHLMKKSLEEVTNIDGVLEHHNDFLDRCLKDCMLTNPDLLKNVSKLMLVCVTFTNCMQRFTQSASAEFVSEEPGQSPMSKRGPPPGEEEKKKTAAKAEADHMTQMMSGEDFEKTIQNFDVNFSRLLLDLLERLSHYSSTDCEHQMLNIIARLDHNGYYTAQLEKRTAEESIYAENQDTGESQLTRADLAQFPTTPHDDFQPGDRGSVSASGSMRSTLPMDNLNPRLGGQQKPVSMPDLSEGRRGRR